MEHIARYGGEHWISNLLCRNDLNAHPEEAKACGELKKMLRKQHRHDRVNYTSAKVPFIQSSIHKAESAAETPNLVQGIIFDMDNTLLQSRIDFAAMKQDIFTFLGSLGALPDDYEPSAHTSATLIEHAKQKGLTSEQELMVWEIATRHELLGMEGAGLEQEVKHLLALLDRQYILVVVTNNSLKAAQQALVSTGISDYFDLIVGREQMSSLKPSPSAFYYVKNKFSHIPDSGWISLGDSWIDGKASTEAGIRFISYQTDLELMRARGVQPIGQVHTMLELMNYLD
jgi:phosphoglycolate phosphatase